MSDEFLPVRQAYNVWAEQYDTNRNRTRDLEGIALREMLADRAFHRCLEIGCGTGKNTAWLAEKAGEVTAVDFSEEMLARAQEKVTAPHVRFVRADIREPWAFAGGPLYDLVSFSLVLEHIRDLEPLFAQAASVLSPGGILYAGELHPFKQYQGTKARFETGGGLQVVECYNHHLSDFFVAGSRSGLHPEVLQEYFDEDRGSVPRVLALIFTKKA